MTPWEYEGAQITAAEVEGAWPSAKKTWEQQLQNSNLEAAQTLSVRE